MTSAQEKKLLQTILKLLQSQPQKRRLKYLKRQLVALPFSLVAAGAVLGTIIEPNIYKVLLAVACFVSGVSLAILVWNVRASHQWPILAGIIDPSKVKARLHELGV